MNTNHKAIVRSSKHGDASDLSTQRLVSGHPFLEGMSPHHLRLLGDSAMKAQFNTDELIFREGEPANGFYLIEKGKVTLESSAHGKANKVVQVIGSGDVLGWSWLFPPYLWHFEARALVPTEAVFIYATPLREEGDFDHELGYELLKRMAEVMLSRLQALRR